jgi:hypothetical protein
MLVECSDDLLAIAFQREIWLLNMIDYSKKEVINCEDNIACMKLVQEQLIYSTFDG